MQLGKLIAENQHIPVCIINGAMGGTTIIYHYRNVDPGSIYGAALFRLTKAGLRDNLKAIFWFQGESDCGDPQGLGAAYKTNFLSLYSSWKSDYPFVERFYVMQLRAGSCFMSTADIVTEQQREIPIGHPDISLMSTTAVPGWDGCHYDTTGYKNIGSRLHGLVMRDFYGLSSADIEPANIINAYFSDANHTRLVLQLSSPVVQPTDQSVKTGFSLDGTAGLVDSVKADPVNQTLVLVVHGASGASRVSYLAAECAGSPYMGPWITNARGVGILMFKDFPVSSGPTSISSALADEPRKVSSVKHYSHCIANPGIHCRNEIADFYTIKGTRINIARKVGRQVVIAGRKEGL
jgi:hypothetical protein